MSFFEQKSLPPEKQKGVLKVSSSEPRASAPSEGYHLSRLLFPSLSEFNCDFLCYVCKQVVKSPLECPECQILFCLECS